MRYVLALVFISISLGLSASKPNTKKVLEEGKYLYTLEKASWISTDHFLRAFPEKTDSVTGYFSYRSGEYLYTVFYYKFQDIKPLARYRFLYDNPVEIIGIPETKRVELTDLEVDYITIRQNAAERILSNKEGYFTIYENIGLNLIPVINGDERKVYILSGSKTDGYLFLGNDYLLSYNQNNKFRGVERIHKSIIKLPTKRGIDKSVKATMHSHLLSDIIDATDICTLLLYRDFVDWDLHYVIGKKYVSIFNLRTEELAIMKTKKWRKISQQSSL